jgi:uncharacterized protein YjiS (DUF1127 family)
MTISDWTSAISSESLRNLADLNGVAVALATRIASAFRRRRAPHRIDSLDARLLRDIGYTRHGVHEAVLAARNEASR